MVPSLEGYDDFIGSFDPAEGMRIRVHFGEMRLDRNLGFHREVEHVAPQWQPSRIGKIVVNSMDTNADRDKCGTNLYDALLQEPFFIGRLA